MRGGRWEGSPNAGPGEWSRALRDWCAADPHRAPQGGFWSRMAGSFSRQSDLQTRHGSFIEQREEAVARILRAHAERSTALDLSGLALSELPPGLGRLDQLETIDLSGNTGFYRLPEVLAQCTGLRAISARNSFVTEVPAALFALPHLETLDLSANFELCELPQEIGQAVRLRQLLLSHCRFSTLPAAVAALPALELLDLSHNPRLHAVPPSAASGACRVKLQGTPAEFTAQLLHAPAWTQAERTVLSDRLRTMASRATALQGASGAAFDDGPRLALFLQERADGMATAQSWKDAARLVDAWVGAGRPFSADALLELGWIANGRPSTGPSLRAHEFQRVPAGGQWAEPAVAAFRSYPPVQSLRGQMEEIAARLERRLSRDAPLAAVECAALLYRAFVSLRPLPAGNAPAALLAMDWALLRQGLPPMRLPAGDDELCDAMMFSDDRSPDGARELVHQVAEGLAQWEAPRAPGRAAAD
ncbi:XopAC/AvrAC family type III secretion system effector [Paracidovorax avenae]|uniref:XopAC/AvrAC family type III secretion system effector n=1 Tax=Paracidovorax avenae TaxID=80867 RepID=UPI00339D28B6